MLGTTGLYHRIRAERTGEKISRREEGFFILVTLRLFGLLAWVGLMTYLLNPRWMAWSALNLPDWMRWLGVCLAMVAVPLFHWMLRSLGTNITDTVVTRKEATLVTHGPYRFVRHPMYSTTFLLFVGFTLLTSNWFFGLTGIVTLAILVYRTSIEEKKLIEKFGEAYRSYMKETPRFMPRLLP